MNARAEQILSVDDEQFLVRLRLHDQRRFVYDYDWLTGPNQGYGFSSSGGFEQSEDEHLEQIRSFLADIDPGTGYLTDG